VSLISSVQALGDTIARRFQVTDSNQGPATGVYVRRIGVEGRGVPGSLSRDTSAKAAKV